MSSESDTEQVASGTVQGLTNAILITLIAPGIVVTILRRLSAPAVVATRHDLGERYHRLGGFVRWVVHYVRPGTAFAFTVGTSFRRGSGSIRLFGGVELPRGPCSCTCGGRTARFGGKSTGESGREHRSTHGPPVCPAGACQTPLASTCSSYPRGSSPPECCLSRCAVPSGRTSFFVVWPLLWKVNCGRGLLGRHPSMMPTGAQRVETGPRSEPHCRPGTATPQLLSVRYPDQTRSDGFGEILDTQ